MTDSRPPPWRISHAGRCPRALVFEAVGEKPLEPGERVMAMAEEGKALESVLERVLRDEGWQTSNYWNEHPENPVRIPASGKALLIGHPDRLIWNDRMEAIAEFKSVNSRWFWQLRKLGLQQMFPEYYTQIQLYLEGVDLDVGLLLAINRAPEGQIYRETVFREHDYVAESLAIVGKARQAQSFQDMPCSSNDRIRKYCPFGYLCKSKWANSTAKIRSGLAGWG